ncbi:uncharacterized protein LOC129574349 [Sitodiplosis mosellana]|uniref:uncharacterized protein LOC129574349 n=1 Tax=Sitodiplosis mosellana TaxID=263140 RepID=UPI002444D168|nr:uncharacterized protein LOC129574349 [Sitodiplosis mosellana]
MATLLDLNGRCLRKIWDYLAVSDLTNVAEAAEITDQAVRRWDNTKTSFAQKCFQFARSLQKVFYKKNGTCVQIDCIDGKHKVPFDLKLLQRFGNLIDYLYVKYDNDDDRMALMVDDAILSFCYQSLRCLHLINIDEDTLSTIWRPFPNVRDLILINGYLSENLSQFNTWFPNMQLLKLSSMQFDTSECIEQHFPHLKVLNLSNEEFVLDEYNDYNSRITDSNAKIAIQLNPQLCALKLADDEAGRDDFGIRVNRQFLYFVQQKLPHLHSLALDLHHLNEQSSYGLGCIEFDNLKKLEILVRKPDFLSKIPISSHRLNDLTVAISNDWNSSTTANFDNIARFIENNPSDKLYIEDHFSNYDLYSGNMIGLVNQLPKLKEMGIVYDCQGTTSIDAIIYFLFNCKRIRKFIAYNPISGNAIEPNTFAEFFESYAEINAFDANAWILEFGSRKIKTHGTQQFISFRKRRTK